ncbi:MAG: DDE-type integrase/transposase/recombinase [Pirellulaceae bacterium]|nr:DDE-type integrase/transposase/recombinase [Pirellulaceae bacterium]
MISVSRPSLMPISTGCDRNSWAPSKKGTGFVQPDGPHRHWHVDICYRNLAGTFFFTITVLDGYSRFIVHAEIRESAKEDDVEAVVQRALEKFPGVKPRITDRSELYSTCPYRSESVRRKLPTRDALHRDLGRHDGNDSTISWPRHPESKTPFRTDGIAGIRHCLRSTRRIAYGASRRVPKRFDRSSVAFDGHTRFRHVGFPTRAVVGSHHRE